MVAVEAQLEAHEEQDEQGGGQAHGQAGEVKESEALLPPHLAQSDLDVVPSESGDEARRLPGRTPGAAARMGLEVLGSETVRPARRSQGFGEGVLGRFSPPDQLLDLVAQVRFELGDMPVLESRISA